MRDNVLDAVGRPPCPTCGASEGDPCRTPTFRSRAPHQARQQGSCDCSTCLAIETDRAWRVAGKERMTYNADRHDFRYVTAGDGRMRMECNCGKRSHWADTYRPVMQAQDRHADQVARGNR